jgi:hypothetical protein
VTLDGSLERFSETWPRAGMTRSGIAYQCPPLAPLTDVIASGLWPTPCAQEVKATERGTWPTPDASPHKYRLQGSSQQSKSLNGIHGGSLNPTWVEWLMGYPLGWTVCAAWATRSSRRSRNGSGGKSSRGKRK